MGSGASIHTEDVDSGASEQPIDVDDFTQELQPTTTKPKKMPPKHVFRKSISQMAEIEKKDLERGHPELVQTLKAFEPCVQFMKKAENRNVQGNEDIEKIFQRFDNLLKKNILSAFTKYEETGQRIVMGNKLVDLGFIPEAVSYYIFAMEETEILHITNPLVSEVKDTNDPGVQLLLTLREIFWNFSDDNATFAVELSKTKLFSLLSGDLEAIYEDTLEDLYVADDMFAFSSAVGIFHNCAREFDVDRKTFRDVDAANHLLPFLESQHVFVKMITLLALVHIIGETEIDKLGTDDPEVFDFLLKEIQNACNDRNQRSNGFSVSELVDGLASLAKADSNRLHIMDKKPQPLMKQLLKRPEKNTKLATVRLIWELCFNEKTRKQLQKDVELYKLVEGLQQGEDDLAKDAQNALFCIKGNISRRDSQQPMIDRDLQAIQRPNAQQHIMISYNWADQKIIKKIAEELESNGFPVWLDIYFMSNYRDLLAGMAAAVEGAFLVLLCYSEKYKESRNCRLEAEYTFAKQKPYMCLKMQRNYNPDGWLGIMIGPKLFYEFTEKFPFETKFKELYKAIKDKFPNNSDSPDGANDKPSGHPSLPPPASNPEPVNQWGPEKIQGWLRLNKLEPGKLKALKTLTGDQIVFLHNVYKHAGDTFYRFLETKLELKSLEDIMRFTNAVTSLKIS